MIYSVLCIYEYNTPNVKGFMLLYAYMNTTPPKVKLLKWYIQYYAYMNTTLSKEKWLSTQYNET